MKINFSKIKNNVQKFIRNLLQENSINNSYVEKNAPRSVHPLTCPNCGGSFSRDNLTDCDKIVTCEYCKETYSTDEIFGRTEKERLEEIRANTYKSVEKRKYEVQRDIELAKLKYTAEKEKEGWRRDQGQQGPKERL